ncbi:MAG TPA: alpha/beta hydrolase, partial [Micromonosporaceae bacterium]
MTEDQPAFADRELDEFMATLATMPPMTASGDVTELRRVTAERSAQRPPGPALNTQSILVGAIDTRLYRPEPAVDGIVVFLHGGGWTIGDLDTHDRACRRLAARSHVPVLAVDYRLAPEHPAPAAVDDAIAVLDWLATGPVALGRRPAVTVIAGDSAGGTLAVLAALARRDSEAAADAVVMVYANTHLAAADGSMVAFAHGFGLDIDDIHWFNSNWVPDSARWSDPDVSPLTVADLTGLPEIVVVTCEFDPLRDEGAAYAAAMSAAGVDARHLPCPGQIHSSVPMVGVILSAEGA